jgi:signal transduction histidine kinase
MKSNLDPAIIELESKILILERENEILSAKAEENLLLNRAFKEINVYEDTDNLLLNTLEGISVLLNVQFSGIFDRIDNNFVCRKSYALFSNVDNIEVRFNTSENILKLISSDTTCFLKTSNQDFSFSYEGSDFEADNAVIVGLNKQISDNRFFVFINDFLAGSLGERIPLFKMVIQIISNRLERAYYQEELEKMNNELEKKVEARTILLKKQNKEFAELNDEYKKTILELKIAKKRAEESDKLKSAFLANMSHEIRTPMNGILGFASLLSEPGLTGEMQQEYLKIIEKSGARMLNIINDIIDISKIEAGLMHVDIRDLNINEKIEFIHLFFKHQAEEKGINLLCNIPSPGKELIIKSDSEKIYSILTNLVKNAIKYTTVGQIEIGYKFAGKSEKGTLLEFFVKDSGMGIPGDRQSAIFERFVQADISDKMAFQGAGLGLSISHAYVKMLGGEIWVESEVGKGSVFYFTIPCIIPDIKKTEIGKTSGSSDRISISGMLKILVADDDETSEMFISLLVKDICKELIKSGTGHETIEICRNNPDIDLIMMDIQMPEINGFEASRQIRQFNNDVIIIAQTAFALSSDRQKALDAGCNDYISKPVLKEEFLALIKKYFGN